VIYYGHYDNDGNYIGFYVEEVHGNCMPQPLIKLTEVERSEAAKGGYKVVDGKHTCVGIEKPTKEQVLVLVRIERDEKLRNLQDRINRYINQKTFGLPTTDSDDNMQKIANYMQTLRDFPAKCNPDNIIWPESPDFIKSEVK
jgi:hypothetical protein